MVRRCFALALVVLSAVPVSAQVLAAGQWPGVTPPIFAAPSSGVTGSGVVTAPQLLASDGSASAPSYSFANEPTFGLSRVGTQHLLLGPTTDATVTFQIGSTSAGARRLELLNTLSGPHLRSNWGSGSAVPLGFSAGVSDPQWQITGATGHWVALGAHKVLGGGVMSPLNTVATITTAGAVTYTAANLVGGMILRNPSGASRSDVTPTAALLLVELPGAQVGQAFEFTIRNTATAAETITVTAGTGATVSGTMTIAQNNSKRFMVVFTNVTAASEAYTLFSLGTVVY